jgi:threonylcarbamoyladenosine tRNA methylthiotransferase MtaB
MTATPEILTFGCRLNAYESEVMRKHAEKAGLANTVIVNSCAVTKEAERSVRQAIRRARKKNPAAKIIVTGCASQINPESYAAMDEVDLVVGNDLKLQESVWGNLNPSPDVAHAPSPSPRGEGKPTEERQGEGISDYKNKILINNIMEVEETASHLVDGFDGKARAFLQVQNGCDHRCTFCIIPYGRGNSRSVPLGQIVKNVRHLVAKGFNEIVLTGVDVTSYGPDLPGKPTLGQMIKRLFALVPELPRLRLSSLDPVEIDADLWWLIEHEHRFMPHLHLSLQAGDDMVLRRMKRRHLRDDVIKVCDKARRLRSDIVFGADIIAGFPTETDAMFQNTLNIVEKCDLTFLHVFPYSEREGTPAAKMPQVDPAVRKERAKLLREAGKKQILEFNQAQIGKITSAIIEQNGHGRTDHFAEVKLDKKLEAGRLVQIKITDFIDGQLMGEVL